MRTFGYVSLCAWSLGLTLLVAIVLWRVGLIHSDGVSWTRNVLGYGHFTLAYFFTWRLVRQQLNSLWASLGYVAAFVGMVCLYIIAQRWWFSPSTNLLFIMSLFMTHHAANEILFRQQSSNGYQSFRWTRRRMLWVALAVGLVFLDRVGSPMHPWHRAQPWFATLWALGWVVYGGCYIGGALCSRAVVVGWVSGGIFWALCFLHPWRRLIFTTQYAFSWIVIYHYVAWYAFYTQKLAYRTGGWSAPSPSRWSGTLLWRFVTTVPIGFLALVVFGNLIIVIAALAADPVASRIRHATQLNFFEIHTVAHILFGVGLPSAPAARTRARPLAADELLPQFA